MSVQLVIAYDNVFTRGTLSASSDPEGGEKENAVDGFTFDAWEPDGSGDHTLQVQMTESPSAQPCDYLFVHAHNLSTIGGTIRLEGSGNGSSWTNVSGTKTPTSDGPHLWRFTQAAYEYWRVVVTGTGAVIGCVQAGVALIPPVGIFVGVPPPNLNRINVIQNSESEGGQFLGRSRIRQGAMFKLELDHVTPAWVRTEWAAFRDHAEDKPFALAWRHDDYPEEVMYAWSEGDARADQSSVSYMKVSIPLAGQVE